MCVRARVKRRKRAPAPTSGCRHGHALDGLLPLGLHLDGKVHDRHFVLVLQQVPEQKRHVGVARAHGLLRHILNLNGDVTSLLHEELLVLHRRGGGIGRGQDRSDAARHAAGVGTRRHASARRTAKTHLGVVAHFVAVAQNAMPRAGKVVKLEDAGVVLRQLLARVPRRVAKALEPAVLGEANAGGLVERGVELVGKLAVLVRPRLEERGGG